MTWYGYAALAEREIVPLAVLESPCRFREAAIAALETSGRPWRIATETPNLSTLRAAVAGGLGLTCRTPLFGQEPSLVSASLPPLPEVSSIVRSRGDSEGPMRRLLALTRDVVAASGARL